MATSTQPPPEGTVTVFATNWCPYCAALLAGLNAAGVDYAIVDVDEDAEAGEFVKSVNNGNRVVPTVLYPDGTTATNPAPDEVTARLP